MHATHVDEVDIGLLAASGSFVCMCPTTERDLADGIAPTDRFRHDGVLVSLGSDSHAVIDLFEEARAVELDERLGTGTRGNHRVRELLAAATRRDTGRSAGPTRAGSKSAPPPTSRRSRWGRCAPPVPPPSMRSQRWCSRRAAADVTDVVVAGERVVADGRHRSIDIAAELDGAIRAVWRSVGSAP